MKFKIVFSALIFLLCFCAVYAVGINPGLTNANYNPNSKVEGAYNIYNNKDAPVTVLLTTKGDLTNYLTIPEDRVTIPANSIHATSFSLLMPENLAPGKYDTRIHIAETGGESFLAFAVEYVIIVDVPYQGKHLTLSLVIGGQSTDNLIISAGATNDGSEAVQSSQISVSITDASGNEVFSGTGDTGGVNVKQFVSKLFQADKTNWPESTYTVRIDLLYDGVTASTSESFSTVTAKPEQQQPPAETNLPETKQPENIIPPSAEQQEGIITPSKNNKFVIVGILIIIIVALLVLFNARRKKETPYYQYQYPYR